MSVGIDVTLGEVAASLVLVALAIGVSVWRRTGLENEIAVAVVRSAIQLTAIGYVIQAIFDEDTLAARLRADHGDGRVRRVHRPAPRAAGARTRSGRC